MNQKIKFLKILKRQNKQKKSKNTKKEAQVKNSKKKEDDDCVCVVCDVPWSSAESGEEWVKRNVCTIWVYEDCTYNDLCFFCEG